MQYRQCIDANSVACMLATWHDIHCMHALIVIPILILKYLQMLFFFFSPCYFFVFGFHGDALGEMQSRALAFKKMGLKLSDEVLNHPEDVGQLGC